MRAFLICDVKVKDRDWLRKYLELSQHSLAPYGGVFHVQAGKLEVIEGTWNPEVIILAEFPSMEQARAWYASSEYSAALAIKPQAIERNMILVEGKS